MAEIYDHHTGEEITMGLQGRDVCDEATGAARRIAKDRDKAVILEDAGEAWVVWPDGRTEDVDPTWFG